MRYSRFSAVVSQTGGFIYNSQLENYFGYLATWLTDPGIWLKILTQPKPLLKRSSNG